MYEKLEIRVNKNLLPGKGANAENGSTALKFLNPKNTSDSLDAYFTKTYKG